jgi:serine/threonine protein kinase
MVDAEGYVKLSDFGIVKKIGEKAESDLVGSILFMPPENIK